jgi:hypothetical protein
MSDEGRRDVKAMLAMLESDGPFDHTEGWLSWFATGRDPDGTWGTDIFGTVWKSKLERIATLERELEEEKASKESLQQELDQEKSNHNGTQAEAAKLRKLIAIKLRTLKLRSTAAFENVENAWKSFIKEIDDEDHNLQLESKK